VFAAAGLVWTGAGAATGHDINVTGDAAKCDKTWGPPCFTPANGTVTSINGGDTVTWHVLDGTHTVTPVDPAAFAGSGHLTGPAPAGDQPATDVAVRFVAAAAGSGPVGRGTGQWRDGRRERPPLGGAAAPDSGSAARHPLGRQRPAGPGADPEPARPQGQGRQ